MILVLSIFSMGTINAHQDKPTNSYVKNEPFTFGPKISLNVSSERVGSIYQTHFLPGAEFGLFFRLSLSRFYIQPEVNYVIRNVKDNITDFFYEVKSYKTHHTEWRFIFCAPTLCIINFFIIMPVFILSTDKSFVIRKRKSL